MLLPQRRTRAYTLLELVVVVVTLGILALLAVPTFQKAIARSQDSATETSVAALLREAQALAALEERPVTAADVEAASGDLTIQALGTGVHAETKKVEAWEDGETNAPARATRTDLLYKVDGDVTGVALASASGRCVLGQVEGTSSVQTWTGDAETCTGTSAAAGPDGTAPAAFDPTFTSAAGAPDPTFGGDGDVVHGLHTTAGDDRPGGVAVQDDGKTVIAGSSTGRYDVYLRRLNLDGSLDPTFGADGYVTTDLGSTDWPNDVEILDDGKILVAGTSVATLGGVFAHYPSFIRYNADGTLDKTFNGGGTLVTNVAGSSVQQATDVHVQADGKVVAAVEPQGGVIRLNADGTLDETFGGDGYAEAFTGTHGTKSYSVTQRGGGGYVVAGTVYNGTDLDAALTALTSTGALDTTFNGTGQVQANLTSGDDTYKHVHENADGTILALGDTKSGTDHVLTRYTATGHLDVSYGTNGTATGDSGGPDTVHGAALQADGKLVVTSNGDALVRYDVDGTPDTSFGPSGNGWVSAPHLPEVTVGPDGKITGYGTAEDPDTGRQRSRVARYT